MHSVEDMLISAHAEIVIRAPDSDKLLGHRHVGTRKLLRKSVDVVEVAIRFVLVLLVKFVLVELLIVKLGGCWWGRLWAGECGVMLLHKRTSGWRWWFWIVVKMSSSQNHIETYLEPS